MIASASMRRGTAAGTTWFPMHDTPVMEHSENRFAALAAQLGQLLR